MRNINFANDPAPYLIHSNLNITNPYIMNFTLLLTKPSSHFEVLLSILHLIYSELFNTAGWAEANFLWGR